MKKLAVVVLLIMIGFSIAPAAGFAASPWTTETTWKGQTIGKLDFGVKNFFGGWTELFTEPWGKKGGDFFKYVGLGIFDAVTDTVGGALHIVTFPITQIDVPLRHNGVQLS